MRKYIYISTLIFGVIPTDALPEDLTYLCVSEESTGFYYENGSWGRASFRVSEDKYIIRKLKENEFGFGDEENPYGVFEIGNETPVFRCSVSEYSNNFLCGVGMGEFLFSPESGRYIKTYTEGYWNGENNNDNTPHITRGRCSRI